MRIFTAFIFVFSPAAFAASVSCTQDSNTRKLNCFDPKEVRANGDFRATRMYSGGPDEIEKTPYTIFIDCKAGYIELRDKRGVVFARDQPTKLHSVQLRDNICNSKATQDKTLN